MSGVLFSQADRLIGGAALGAAAVASYALCAQLAQPIYGFTASGLHFLFPYLSGQRVSATAATLRKAVLLALVANVVFVLSSTLGLLLIGNRILLAWGGEAIASSGTSLLPIVAWSSALLGLNVTGSYAMTLTDKCGIGGGRLADLPDNVPIHRKAADDVSKQGSIFFSAEIERPNRAGVKVACAYQVMS